MESPKSARWAVGDIFETEIEKVAHGGHFIARHEGAVFFIRHGIPGEKCRVVITSTGSSFNRGDVVRLFSFKKGQANLVELTLPDGSACIGKTVEEIELPEDATLAAIVRDGRVITAKAHDVFAAGDELLFVASSVAEEKIKACFIA